MNMDMKVEYFFRKNIKVHIICGNTRSFYNGLILDVNFKKQFLIFIDDKLGEIPILFEEIERIEPYVEREVGGK